jgi:hypothetical protein
MGLSGAVPQPGYSATTPGFTHFIDKKEFKNLEAG